VTDGGERGIDILLSICPLPQKGQTVRSIPVNFFKSLIDDSLGTALRILEWVNRWQRRLPVIVTGKKPFW